MNAPFRPPVQLSPDGRFFRGFKYGAVIMLLVYGGLALALAGCWQGDPTLVRGPIDQTIPEETP